MRHVPASLRDLRLLPEGAIEVAGEILPCTQSFLESLAAALGKPMAFAYSIDPDLFRFNFDRLGHSDSSILQLYCHLNESDSQAAMSASAGGGVTSEMKPTLIAVEGNLRATGQSTIENDAQKEAEQIG